MTDRNLEDLQILVNQGFFAIAFTKSVLIFCRKFVKKFLHLDIDQKISNNIVWVDILVREKFSFLF